MADDDYNPSFPGESLRGAPSAMDRLSPELQALAKRMAKSRLDWENAYVHLHDEAQAGRKITAADFRTADDKYSAEAKANTTELDQQITAEMVRQLLDTGRPPAISSRFGRLISNATSRFIKSSIGLEDIKMDVYAATEQVIGEEGDPHRFAAIKDTAPLDAAFMREYISKTAHKKNLVVAPGTHTPAELLADLLAKNPGIAVADIHVRNHSAKLISDNIGTLKKAGVDTLYLEFPDEFFQKIDAMSVKEIKELAATGSGGGIALASAEGNAQAYGVGHSDNAQKAWIEMIATAKENGIRVVNIDKKGAARSDGMNLGMMNRLASTNFIWTDNVTRDRAQLAAQGKPDGKYIVFGGYAHFVNTQHASGLVDDALGVPVIAFDRRDKDAQPFVARPFSLHSADFALPGGGDYPDTNKMAVADDLQSINGALHYVSVIPGVPILQEELKEKTAQYKEAVDKSLDIKPFDFGPPAMGAPIKLPVQEHDPQEAPRPLHTPPHHSPSSGKQR